MGGTVGWGRGAGPGGAWVGPWGGARITVRMSHSVLLLMAHSRPALLVRWVRAPSASLDVAGRICHLPLASQHMDRPARCRECHQYVG